MTRNQSSVSRHGIRKTLILRWLGIILIFCLFLCVGIWRSYKTWLPNFCYWLQRIDQPQASDFIVYLGGNEPERADFAVQLYQNHYASRIIASGHYLRVREGLDILAANNIPQSAIIVNNQANTTWDEAQQILSILVEKHAQSALIVTSASHTRRARASYEKLNENSGLVLSFVAPETNYSCQSWWDSGEGNYVVRYEYPRLVFYIFRYGIFPF